MSYTITIKTFIRSFINTYSKVPSSRLDRTLKALINTFTKESREDIVDYLNKIRIIYYLKRLEYKDSALAKTYKGIYPLLS